MLLAPSDIVVNYAPIVPTFILEHSRQGSQSVRRAFLPIMLSPLMGTWAIGMICGDDDGRGGDVSVGRLRPMIVAFQFAIALVIFFVGVASAADGDAEPRQLASSFDAHFGTLTVYPADCGYDEVHEDCDLLSFSCVTRDGYSSFRGLVERLSDTDLARWLAWNGANLSLKNGEAELTLTAEKIQRDGYDGSWDIEFYTRDDPVRWLNSIDTNLGIVGTTVRGEWAIPRLKAIDKIGAIDSIGLGLGP